MLLRISHYYARRMALYRQYESEFKKLMSAITALAGSTDATQDGNGTDKSEP